MKNFRLGSMIFNGFRVYLLRTFLNFCRLLVIYFIIYWEMLICLFLVIYLCSDVYTIYKVIWNIETLIKKLTRVWKRSSFGHMHTLSTLLRTVILGISLILLILNVLLWVFALVIEIIMLLLMRNQMIPILIIE